ncbi:hypothetical protein DES35_1147 [Schleiferia thermophila]|jgi:hypothetical protein|uniref:Uncharacterized protein n=1 Tax=Schleiferia thermophila TaxID=884107 RepID=A0A368ZU52_9FLAO|nr:hypothetical protein DES35_1147 [Schleiferia thermophila]GCD80916.1 hypothetical protein JCM30197_21630 [Schleiferia thermophila]
MFGRGKNEKQPRGWVADFLFMLTVILYNILLSVDLSSSPHNVIFFGLFITTSLLVKLSNMLILIVLWGVNYFFVSLEIFILVLLYFLMTYIFRLWSFRVFCKDLVLVSGRGFVSEFARGKVKLSWIDILYTVMAFSMAYVYLR